MAWISMERLNRFNFLKNTSVAGKLGILLAVFFSFGIVMSLQVISDLKTSRDGTTLEVIGATEQTSGIEQVNTAVSQLDEMTQQNAALVEEASAAGESMSEQAKELMRKISFFNGGFQVDGSHSPSRQLIKSPVRAAQTRIAAVSSRV